MPVISLTLSEQLLDLSDECAAALRLSRADYVRRALDRMNSYTQARMRADRLHAASQQVREESMRVNAEFDAIERDIDA